MLITDIANRTRKGLFIGLIAALAAAPYLYYQSLGPWGGAIIREWGRNASPVLIFAFQFSLLGTISLICGIIGAFLSEKYALPGIGAGREAWNRSFSCK